MTRKMSVRAMIIDDDESVLFLHELMLDESDFADEIYQFNNAQDALHHLENRETHHPYIIFLDINMPKINGWDFLNHLEKSIPDRQVYVVMVTSSVNITDRKRATNYKHVVNYIEKPLNLEICERLKKLEIFRDFYQENSGRL